MRFTARQDIAAGPSEVFAALSDFAAFERAALRRGAEIVRLDRRVEPGPGMSWQGALPWRGRMRRFVGELKDFRPATALAWQVESGGFRLLLGIGLIPLAAGRTRISVELEVRPETLPARLKLQAARLQKHKLTDRFRQRVLDFAQGVERRA